MMNYLQFKKCRPILTMVFLLFAVTSWGQTYNKGVQTGVVKVKFETKMTSTLRARSTASGISTGITMFDAKANQLQAKNMVRLFPYDAKNESKLQKHGLHLWYVIELDENVDPVEAAKQFKQLSEVETAEVEREKVLAPYEVKAYKPTAATLSAAPFNDPLLVDQWHYNNTGQTGYSDADVNLFEAWSSVTGANDIIVSVHDEGVDVNHVDLSANIWTNVAELNGTPNVDDDGNGYVDDIHGYNFQKKIGAVDPQFHGTHVAGTIAAVNNNGVGVSGVAGGDGSGNGVKIMSLQILGGAAIEKSYVYAANNGAVISQNSWGYSFPGSVEQSVLDAIDYFIAEAGDYPGSPMKGGIVIFASGNSNYDADWYPGYYESTLSVSSIGPDWQKASYSNFGTWVDISAPGGETSLGSKNGVLSTIPKDEYAYLQGTSMACPHVSGIAALALANRTAQLTSQELWNKLVTGVIDLDQYNPGFEGLMGSGTIDASLAIKNDQGIAPNKITDLVVTGIAQEFANLSWSVPSDTDDTTPLAFNLYYHTLPITSGNLHSATKIVLPNKLAAGATYTYEVNELLGLTEYHFALTSTDRWGNISVLSNVVSETTNAGPSIAVDELSQAITLDIDASIATSASHDITILNGAEGILRWNHLTRDVNNYLAYGASSLSYPTAVHTKPASQGHIARRNAAHNSEALRSAEPEALAFESVSKTYSDSPTNIIGETDLSLTNSAATRFFVTEAEGFNLTQVRMYLKHDPAIGPVVMEIYNGTEPSKDNLIYAQEHSNWSADESWAYITLNEQLYFESDATFWVVFHIPAGNLFPLGIGYEMDPSYSENCFMSFDMGASYAPLDDLLGATDFSFSIAADSYNEHLGTYLTLDPGAGDVAGNDQMLTALTADASTLINGTYNANLILTSNDAANQELRVPITVNVSGHQPSIKHVDIADFGSVFVGTSKTIDIVLENTGLGNFNNPSFNIVGTEFEIDGYTPWQIAAREEVLLSLNFSPTVAGNSNDVLTITDGNQTYEISLFGVGAETSEITIDPVSQLVNDVAIGDVVNAQITVENTGEYPLKYFIPGFDTKGVSDNWPTDYHTYGYKYRTNYASEANPVSYDYQDISGSGINVTETLRDDAAYVAVEMGFDFPYYGQPMETLYIAQKGFTTFDNSVRPINTPVLNNSYSPLGYVSILGTYIDMSAQGEIFYQVEADRVIVQYDNITDGYSGSITAQAVYYYNGDIRFFYEDMGFDVSSQPYLNILMENLNHEDGILIHDYTNVTELYSGLALGFDYPGPDIITAITNASGILAPGVSKVVDIELSTASLTEGLINRYINFISNDPFNGQVSGLLQLEVNSGGVAQPIVSKDTVHYGDIFQGATISTPFTIKNTGTADVDISSMTWVNDDFTFTGEQPTSIPSGLYKQYSIEVPTSGLATLEDWLSINYADGSHDTIYVTATVVDPPAINADLTLLQETLDYGTTGTYPYSIENTGLAPLEVTISGKQWLNFETADAATSSSYTYNKYNAGEAYQWIDIRKNGTQLPFAEDAFNKDDFWRDLDLPFAFKYYGTEYNSLKVGDNGLVSFEADPEVMFFNDNIPTSTFDGAYIMPYWTFGGFDTYTFPAEEVGIFYQEFDDHVIITWSYLVNNFGGMGDPISAQLFLYDNGTMKFQYKVEEFGSDQTSSFTAIGLQKDGSTGISISAFNNLDYGSGLAYVISPADMYTVAPGNTMSGDIVLDARNIYGGVYTESLKIKTNVPGSENLEKPVELTVTGDAVAAVEDVDFGSHMVAFEFGSPVMNYVDAKIANEGSAPYTITWAQMADAYQGMSLQIYTLVDGWFGPELRWADISELYSPWAFTTPTFIINPGESLEARAVFAPDASGNFTDDLVLTTDIGDVTITMTGTGFEPPLANVDLTPVLVSMNTESESVSRSIVIDNISGLSALDYEVSIEYGRVGATPTASTATASMITAKLSYEKATINRHAIQTSATYSRSISHTDKVEPDTYVGIGGGEPFSVATAYNAGPDGFNASHIETWFRAESRTEGNIKVEIRAGGNSITESVLISAGEMSFTSDELDEYGAWYEIALNNAAEIYPNEDFYVVVTYPLGIALPQGTIQGVETTVGRYFYSVEGNWYDIQLESGFENMGWLMLTGETVAGNSNWLSISSMPSGALAIGESGSIDLLFEGVNSERGDQIAEVVVRSNDPNNSEIRVPVSLHMNEAPVFAGVNSEYSVYEAEMLTAEVTVTDPEGNAFIVESLEDYEGLSYELSGNNLTINYQPEYEMEGTYSFMFVATDEFDAATEVEVMVNVIHSNRAPEFIDPTMVFEYSELELHSEYAYQDFFVDPDNDDMTYSIASNDGTMAKAFTTGEHFVIQTKAFGTTSVMLTATDVNGAATIQQVSVTVTEIANNAPELVVGAAASLDYIVTDANDVIAFSDYIMDADGDELTYTVASSDVLVAATYLAGGNFIIDPLTAGTTTVTITGTDPDGASVTTDIIVNVAAEQNTAPEVIGTTTSLSYTVEDANSTIAFEDYFMDADGDALTHSASSADVEIVAVYMSGSNFVIDPIAVGSADITIVAMDNHGASARHTITVTVSATPNNVPEYIGSIDALNYAGTGDLDKHSFVELFSDADGDELEYSAESAESTIVEVFLEGSQFVIRPTGVGNTTITIMATDIHGASASHNIAITVDAIAGINDFESDFDLNIYPNPTSGKITINLREQIGENHTVEVINSLGKTVHLIKNITSNDEVELDLTSQPAGVYLVKVAGERGVSVSRIIKK